jgi:hypothetical protein
LLVTLNAASAEGILFTFVPDFYITTMVQLTWLLLTQMHPTVPYTNLHGTHIPQFSLIKYRSLILSYIISNWTF